MSAYASIHVIDAPFCLDNPFDYYIPPDLRRDILCGDFVTVPFGTANKRKLGLVVKLKDTPEKNSIDHKSVIDVCDKTMSLTEETLGLCFFLKEHTLCTVGDAAKAIVPTSAFSKTEVVYFFVEREDAASRLEPSALFVYEYLQSKSKASLSLLKHKYGPAAEPILKKLLNGGFVRKDFEMKSVTPMTAQYYSLNISPERVSDIVSGRDTVRLRSQRQSGVLELLASIGSEIEEKELLESASATKVQLKSLLEKELIRVREQEIDRGLRLLGYEQKNTDITLNEEQNAAYSRLSELIDSEKPCGALLHGVTGSGKTSVMLKTIDRVLKKGRSVIVLLPEIALTPQSLEIFCSRYGERVAVVHSGLSLGERFDTFKRIKRGDADVVIGTRSAVFAPLNNIGLIIIDEEQEHTYKSDMNPKYHTRDVARYRAAHHNALMLLASATPSFESYKKALEGKYTLIELKTRYGDAKLPQAIVADMRDELQASNSSPLGTVLSFRLLENQKNGNQSILFLNRRGYNNFVSCRSCGEAVKCPQCSVSMTYHTSKTSYDSGFLVCHWCGKKAPLPSRCPSCGGEHLARMGYGTQKLEQELSVLLPHATVLRMDTDTTSEKSSYERLLGQFRRHEADVLLGTQMVTKGHDFPDVTLVGVLLADASLYLDDYRAAERTFAMLTQVIGRAGRASKEGVAVIQTNNPDNECIKLACKQDYRAFYESEIKLRKLLVFPPFCDIALLTLSSGDEGELVKASSILSEKLSFFIKGEYSDLPFIVYGPFEAPVYRVDGKFRMRTVIKCNANKRTREMLSRLIEIFSAAGIRNLSLSVDINPSNL